MTLITALQALGNAFASLFQGRPDQFFVYLVDAFPAFAIFMMIYALITTIGVMAIFKDDNHRKFAHWFGIGLGLLGVSNPNVYTFIESFVGGTLLVILLILLVAFFFIAMWKTGRKHSIDMDSEVLQSKTANLGFERDWRKADHDAKLEIDLQNKELNNINESNIALRLINQDELKGKQLLDNIRLAISKIITLQNQGVPAQQEKQRVYDYASANVPLLVTEVSAQVARVEKLEAELQNLEHHEVKAEAELEAETARILTKLKKMHGKTFVGGQEARLRQVIASLHQTVRMKEQKIREIAQHTVAIDREMHNEVEPQKKNLISQLQKGDETAALATISDLIRYFDFVERESAQIEQAEEKLKSYLNQYKQQAQEYDHILRAIELAKNNAAAGRRS